MVEKISQVNLDNINSSCVLDESPVQQTKDLEAPSVFLEKKLQEVKDKQGFLGKASDSIKNNHENCFGSKKCEEMIKKYEKGEISYQEALSAINKYENKQNNTSELVANIVTGITSIAAATLLATGPVGWGISLLVGAPVGAIVKTGFKMLDRATNKVDGDAADSKEIKKDLITGAVTGMTSAVSSGVAAGIKQGSIKLAIKNGAKSGFECGAVAGIASYTADVKTNKNKKFKFGDMLKTAAVSSFVSGTVGGVVGAGIYGTTAVASGVGAAAAQNSNLTSTIVKDSVSSSSRKVLNRAERNILAA